MNAEMTWMTLCSCERRLSPGSRRLGGHIDGSVFILFSREQINTRMGACLQSGSRDGVIVKVKPLAR